MSRGCLRDASRSGILHCTKPIHEPDRDEQHHEGVVVSQSPGGVGDVSRHEGDKPSSQNASAFAEVILGHAGDGEHRQSTVDGRESEHAPPHGIFGCRKEGFQHHSSDGHRPGKERGTWVDASNWIEAVGVKHEVRIVGQDVVDDALHVPRVGTTGHVPVARSKSIHRWNGIPLDTDGQTDQEGQGDHHA